MTLIPTKWTIADYHQMIAAGILDGRPVELLYGEIVNMPPEGPAHAQQSTDAADYLRGMLGEQVLVRDAKPITLSEQDSEPEPDLAIVQPLRTLYRTRHPYPENIFWLIEYANTSLSKDRDAKAKLYAAAGIPEYWIINLKQSELIVMRDPIDGPTGSSTGSKYQSQVTLRTGTVAPLAFPEINLAVLRLLE